MDGGGGGAITPIVEWSVKTERLEPILSNDQLKMKAGTNVL
jgi:hypothetical protein